MSTRAFIRTLCVLAAGTFAVHCNRGGANSSATPAASAPPTTPAAGGTDHAASPPGGGGTAVPAGAQAAAPGGTLGAPTAAPTPSGPRSQIPGEHYALVAAITAPSAVPGDTQLSVEVRGADGYHVNELYPVALELVASNATTPRPTLRRADVAELTQQVASFHVPVHVSAAGAAVSGTMRFAVCSAQNCIPHEQQFAVNLP